MQAPPVTPKVNAPAPNELKPEPIARVAPVVMNDAAARIDPSVVLNTPVPVSQGPRFTQSVRRSLDQTGPLYVSADETADAEASEHISRLTAQLKQRSVSADPVRWPLENLDSARKALKENADSRQSALASSPRASLAVLKEMLVQSPLLATSNLAQALNSGRASAIALAAGAIPSEGSREVQDSLSLLMHGQLLWQGEFTPGVQGRLYREDAYGQDPQAPPGTLAKGTQISVQVNLPRLGELRIRGIEIAGTVSLLIEPLPAAERAFRERLDDLSTQLNGADLESVSVHLQAQYG